MWGTLPSALARALWNMNRVRKQRIFCAVASEQEIYVRPIIDYFIISFFYEDHAD